MAPQCYCETAWQGGWLQYPAQWGISFRKGETQCYPHLIAGMTFEATVGTFTHNLVRNVSHPWGLMAAAVAAKWGAERAQGLWEEGSATGPAQIVLWRHHASLSLSKKVCDLSKWYKETQVPFCSSLVARHTEMTPFRAVGGRNSMLSGVEAKRQTRSQCSRFCLSWKFGGEGWEKRIGRRQGLSKACVCRMWEARGTVPKLKLGGLCLDNCFNADLSCFQRN